MGVVVVNVMCRGCMSMNVTFHLSVDTKPPQLALSASKEVCVRKSEGVALLVADSKAEQGRWIAALNTVINTALTWKQA